MLSQLLPVSYAIVLDEADSVYNLLDEAEFVFLCGFNQAAFSPLKVRGPILIRVYRNSIAFDMPKACNCFS